MSELTKLLKELTSLQKTMDSADGEIWHDDESFAFGFEAGYESASEEYSQQLECIIIDLKRVVSEELHEYLNRRIEVPAEQQQLL